MKVVLSGGGTLGSVSPLLAVAEELRKKDSSVEFLWIGTKKGPERTFVEENQIPFKSIVAGKWRRYFDLRNIIDLFKIDIGFWQSFFILRKFLRQPPCHSEGAERPRNLAGVPITSGRPAARHCVFVSAGGFVSVPAALAAHILKIPILIHQQDVVPGLANKLTSAMAKKITVSLDISLKDFPFDRTEWIGNPVRSFIFSGNSVESKKKLNLKEGLPVLLVMGGGTGAKAINELVMKSLPELVKFCQVIHLSGKRKSVLSDLSVLSVLSNYHPLEFVTSEIADLYAAADLVVSRAGMSSLSEICALGKPSIIIPIPNSHQEKNAEYFASHGAVKIFKRPSLSVIPSVSEESRGSPQGDPRAKSDVDIFVNLANELLFNQSEREKLSESAKKIMPQDAAKRMAEIIMDMAK